jgi:hypothetical protein
MPDKRRTEKGRTEKIRTEKKGISIQNERKNKKEKFRWKSGVFNRLLWKSRWKTRSFQQSDVENHVEM